MTVLRGLPLLLLVLATGCRDAARPAPRVFVSNEHDGTVSVIDTATRRVTATIPVGKRPRGLRVGPDGDVLFVALSGSPKAPPGVDEATLPPPDRSADGIGVIDLDQLELVRTLPSGQDPESFDLTEAGALVVSNEETGEVSILSPGGHNVRAKVAVGGEPEGVTTAPDGTVWVTSEADHRIDLVDPDRTEHLGTIAVGQRPRQILFAQGGATAFVTNELSASVSVIDVRTRAVRATVTLPSTGAPRRPMGLARSRDGRAIYVTTGRGGTLAVLDATTGQLQREIAEVGPRPWGVATAPDGLIYVASGPSNDVAVVDPAAGVVVTRIPVGGSPWGVVVDR